MTRLRYRTYFFFGVAAMGTTPQGGGRYFIISIYRNWVWLLTKFCNFVYDSP